MDIWRDLETSGHVSFLNTQSNHAQPLMGEKRDIPESVLKAYRLNEQTDRIERFGHVFRIDDPKGKFALKKVKLSTDEQNRLLQFQQMSQQSPIRTPPLFQTAEGQYFYREGADTYFLMPWIQESESARSDQWEYIWDTLAEWHRVTQTSIEVDASWRETFTEKCLEVWSEQVLSLDLFMHDCEHRIYPSPFEQRFMAFYHELRSGAEDAYRRMKAWEESLSDEKTLRLVHCHGKPSLRHLIVSGRQRNWISTEASGFDLPVRDLTWLLKWGVDQEPIEALQRGIDIYEMTNPLEAYEKKLLLAQLSHPGSVVYLLHLYKESRGSNRNEREQTIQLEEAFHHWGKTYQALAPKLEESDKKEEDRHDHETKEE